MDTLRIAPADSGLVGSEMPQAFESDDDERLLCRRQRRNGDRSGEYRPIQRAFEKGVAPFRLRTRFVGNRNASCETPREHGRIVAFSVLQFDLNLADVGVIIGRIDAAIIEREFDLTVADAEKHHDAVDVGLEDGMKLIFDLAA